MLVRLELEQIKKRKKLVITLMTFLQLKKYNTFLLICYFKVKSKVQSSSPRAISKKKVKGTLVTLNKLKL